MEAVKKKMLATLVGCNYASTENELQGCINDVHAMRAVLLDPFGFAPGDVTVLTDDHESGTGVLPTGSQAATSSACWPTWWHARRPGTCSSSTSAATARSSRPSAAMAAATTRPSCPATSTSSQVRVYAHVDFRELVDRVPRGATFTMVSESCYSGGLIDQEEQIGPDAAADPDLHAHAVHAGRFLPYAVVLGHLLSGVGASHHVADHLVALFGDDASSKFRFHRHDHHGGNSSGAAHADDAGILLSRCQKDELSVDVPGDGSKQAHGAFSGALQVVLAAHPAPMSNRELVLGGREVLGKRRGSSSTPASTAATLMSTCRSWGSRRPRPRATEQGGGCHAPLS
ncbi:unnamed protein product [Miscanthus lutarioriparius]|uniref:Peptidase C14 caspase domain-containing protein n=1 Tax=Miscanthus lutarioriparius TaxID=422564 RepID=A0A811QLK6_9POAL|nr:unnamed protein product [Miscanthus lutarioriparius]